MTLEERDAPVSPAGLSTVVDAGASTSEHASNGEARHEWPSAFLEETVSDIMALANPSIPWNQALAVRAPVEPPRAEKQPAAPKPLRTVTGSPPPAPARPHPVVNFVRLLLSALTFANTIENDPPARQRERALDWLNRIPE